MTGRANECRCKFRCETSSKVLPGIGRTRLELGSINTVVRKSGVTNVICCLNFRVPSVALTGLWVTFCWDTSTREKSVQCLVATLFLSSGRFLCISLIKRAANRPRIPILGACGWAPSTTRLTCFLCSVLLLLLFLGINCNL